jgi:hypothetical protein
MMPAASLTDCFSMHKSHRLQATYIAGEPQLSLIEL